MRDIDHEPQTPDGWVEHWHDEVIEELARDIVRFMPEDDRADAGLPDDPEDVDVEDEWIAAIGQVSESLIHLVGAREDPRSESVTLDQIGGYVLAYGHYHGAEVAVRLDWRTVWTDDDYPSAITPARDLFVYVHPDHNAQLVASVLGG